MSSKYFSLTITFLSLVFFLSPAFSQGEGGGGGAPQNETITLVTYYPSPIGIYKELRAKRMAVGDSYYDTSQYCWSPDNCSNQIDGTGAPCWPNCNTDLVVEGNVGIGTITPAQKLDVAGYVKGQSGLCIGNDCRTSWPDGGPPAPYKWVTMGQAMAVLKEGAYLEGEWIRGYCKGYARVQNGQIQTRIKTTSGRLDSGWVDGPIAKAAFSADVFLGAAVATTEGLHTVCRDYDVDVPGRTITYSEFKPWSGNIQFLYIQP